MQTTLISLEVNYAVDFSYESRPQVFHKQIKEDLDTVACMTQKAVTELLLSNY
jgi:phosphopantetheine adenylyltransferase